MTFFERGGRGQDRITKFSWQQFLITCLVSFDDKKPETSREEYKFLCFHKIFVPNMITAGWLHYFDGIGQHIKLMKIYPFTFSFPLTQLYRNFRFHFLDSEVTIYFIISTFTRATSENTLSLQTKGVLILVPGIFGVLSNISLMLIILSIASAQRYCLRNVKSYEQKPLYLRKETLSIFCFYSIPGLW